MMNETQMIAFMREQKNRVFMEEMMIYQNALSMIAQRQLFYEAVLRGDKDLVKKYGSLLGKTNLKGRVENALVAARKKGKKLVEQTAYHLNNLEENYDSGSRRLYLEENTPCEIVGVCVCEFGNRLPYIGSCNGDETAIEEDPILCEKRMSDKSDGLVHLLG